MKEGWNTWATTHKRSWELIEEYGIIQKDLSQNTNAIFWLFLSEKCFQKYYAAFSFNSQDLCTLVAFETPAVQAGFQGSSPARGEPEASAVRANASSGASPGDIAGSPHGDTRTVPFENGAAASPARPHPSCLEIPPQLPSYLCIALFQDS